MAVVLFPLSRQVAASHPEQASGLLGGPAAAKDILAMEIELIPRCQETPEQDHSRHGGETLHLSQGCRLFPAFENEAEGGRVG